MLSISFILIIEVLLHWPFCLHCWVLCIYFLITMSPVLLHSVVSWLVYLVWTSFYSVVAPAPPVTPRPLSPLADVRMAVRRRHKCRPPISWTTGLRYRKHLTADKPKENTGRNHQTKIPTVNPKQKEMMKVNRGRSGDGSATCGATMIRSRGNSKCGGDSLVVIVSQRIQKLYNVGSLVTIKWGKDPTWEHYVRYTPSRIL